MAEPVAPSPTKPEGEGAPISKRYLIILAGVMLLFALLAFVGFNWMQSNALAVLLEYSGEANRDTSAKMQKWFQAKQGDEFENGDGARTHAGATAQFALANGARLVLKPASQIRFQHKPKGKGALGISVEVGEVDIRTNEGALSLDSEFGQIVIDSGSLLTLRRDGDRLAFQVEVGRVELIESQRSLVAGEELKLEIGGILVEEMVNEGPDGEAKSEVETHDETSLSLGDGLARADLTVKAGSSFTVHDPNPPTVIGFVFDSVCTGPGRVSLGALATEAKVQGNLPVKLGTHKYEVRCMSDADKVAAQGTVVVVRDSGSKSLPNFTPQASVATDGRRYTVLYQDRLPRVTVTWPSAPEASQYSLKINGRSIATSGPQHTFSSLKRGSHQLVFLANSTPPRESRATLVEVSYDSQAPKGRVSEPRGSFSPGTSVRVAGQALPGWSVSLNGTALQMDPEGRFLTEIQPNGTLPIAFSHPTHGMHYYLRRPQGS